MRGFLLFLFRLERPIILKFFVALKIGGILRAFLNFLLSDAKYRKNIPACTIILKYTIVISKIYKPFTALGDTPVLSASIVYAFTMVYNVRQTNIFNLSMGCLPTQKHKTNQDIA